MAQKSLRELLTAPEFRMVSMIACGKTAIEIATAMGVTVPAVRYRIRRLLRKTGAADQLELTNLYLQECPPGRSKLVSPLASVGTKIPAHWLPVAELLVNGRSNQEISTALGVSVSTVKFYITWMLRDAGVKSRRALVAHLAANPSYWGTELTVAPWRDYAAEYDASAPKYRRR